ncbi:MAG: membrane protein insertase YidC [Candidatus Izemoplasmatales bacterium]|jgi:YidC/Oxa1 family membrane protein insertase
MKKNRILTIIIAIVLLFGLAGCGSKPGVTYKNYQSILTVEDNPTEIPTSLSRVAELLGSPDSLATVDANGTGYLEWNVDGAFVRVTFEDYRAMDKEQTGLYESVYQTPIGVRTGVWEWVIKQIGYFTYFASNLFGLLGTNYYYWLGLLLMTLVIRTLGWPIYAKSNDMTIKMQMAQPEINRVQEKYRGRTDQASQQRMQLETMEIYKKYKINFFGCLMPLLQMPIFIAMYQVVQRFPLDTTIFGNATINTKFLWTHLGNTYWLENLPLALIVAGTMFLSQWLMQQRTKANQKNNRYVDAKAQQSQKMMKFMMYFMIVMMGYISIMNAGIAFYWIIGNVYQLFQSHLSHRKMSQRQEQLRKKF